MLVKMLSDHDDSLNGGRTIQRFESGKTYDVPDEIALAWIAAKAAVTACKVASSKIPRNDKREE